MDSTECQMIKKMQQEREMLQRRGEELTGFWPIVHFRIPAIGLQTWRYHKFIKNLLIEFVAQADPRNKQEAEVMGYRGFGRLNEESGIGMCTIDNIFVAHCKMYVCDGTRDSKSYNPSHNWKPWRGLLFRDHVEPNPTFTTAKVFTIADAFEKFLVSKGIKFKRINTTRERSK